MADRTDSAVRSKMIDPAKVAAFLEDWEPGDREWAIKYSDPWWHHREREWEAWGPDGWWVNREPGDEESREYEKYGLRRGVPLHHAFAKLHGLTPAKGQRIFAIPKPMDTPLPVLARFVDALTLRMEAMEERMRDVDERTRLLVRIAADSHGPPPVKAPPLDPPPSDTFSTISHVLSTQPKPVHTKVGPRPRPSSPVGSGPVGAVRDE